MTTKIAIIGAGSFGIALSKLFSSYKNCSVILWSFIEEEISYIKNNNGRSKTLPKIFIDVNKVFLTCNMNDIKKADLVIFAVASKYMRNVTRQISGYIKKDAALLNVSKGLEEKTFKRMSEIIFDETKSKNIAVLSGPSHAEEIAVFSPTTVVIASKNFELAEKIQEMLTSSIFRIYVNEDIIGVEIAAALKNIIALAVGVCDGLGLGDNTKAALMTRGLFEIAKLGISLGAKSKTFAGLSGVGDLIATCTSVHSRNKKAGFLIGKGFEVEKALKEVDMTVEGYFATKTAHDLSKIKNIDMPITDQLYKILYEKKEIRSSIKSLMERPLKKEYEKFWFN